ncbi:MAG: SIMPL domain-containing protein [Planctomycetes bacterium]|nr:SIMPL domain-containing protein [Planctomycetota bacterium]
MQRAMLTATFGAVLFVVTASAEDRRTVSVTGYAETQVEPDIATIEMGIFVFDASLLKGKREADAKIASLLNAFETLGVKPSDVQTTQLYVKPKYKDVERGWQFVGYEITRSVTVALRDMKLLNELLNESIKAGANRLERINLRSSKQREIEDQLLREAIENAKRQAARLAHGFGAKVGKVLTIDASGEALLSGVRYCLSAPAFGETTFQPGRIKIESEIHVVFELTD